MTRLRRAPVRIEFLEQSNLFADAQLVLSRTLVSARCTAGIRAELAETTVGTGVFFFIRHYGALARVEPHL